MTLYAHLDPADASGLRPVREIITVPDGLTLGEDFGSTDLAAACVPCDGSVVAGLVYDPKAETFAAAPAPVLTIAELLAYASDRQNAVLAGVWSFDVAAASQPAHTVTTKLDERGQFAMMKVQGWLTLNASNAAATMPYSNVDFSATSLTVAEADSLVDQAAALDVKSYALLNQVQAGVSATPPSITTTAQIDQVFAGLTV